mmetsp:Transcript_17107/g.31948  ORF Transcript_17107/g.31948 Transcript_17107/m.31948 type:complete len:645 (-) Transcript_17107:134-2068(-)|eukprot:CAMPEP_0197446902 /NCGR_PEP_ID=MMETSP1175-20131217/11714_1 /TAXON_ID=1003142 /ORGANISM="Triceratium dubium, Strain CCMP147" /LENGTH=644 /DNA_ID=CAMNT_0042978075 /DNA_START=24 /DNA_END=1958 /DNA_ORIENTATION=-
MVPKPETPPSSIQLSELEQHQGTTDVSSGTHQQISEPAAIMSSPPSSTPARAKRSIIVFVTIVGVTVTVLGSLAIAYLAKEVHDLNRAVMHPGNYDGGYGTASGTVSDGGSISGSTYNESHNGTSASTGTNKALESLPAKVHDLEARVKNQEFEINQLRAQMSVAVNSTITFLNDTVAEAQQSMQKEVQSVDEEVDKQGSLMAYQAAGFFTLLTVLVFIWHLTHHLQNMHEPTVQRKILAILWMSPLYAITSWLSLILVSSTKAAEWYLAVIKDCYEAYLLYTFLSFLIAVLGKGKRDAVVDLLADKADHLRPPLDFCGLFFNEKRYEFNPRGRADAILFQCQFCTLQFVFLRPITSLGMALSNQFYGTDWDYRAPQFVFVLMQNVSIFLAFSGLLKFYHATREDLSWCNPFPKFLCIKGVVFMTFWQGMVITILAKAVFHVDDPMEWSRQAQNFLTCLEMLFFAIAHCFAFPPDEWKPGYTPRTRSERAKFGDNIALRDFAKDVKFILKSRKKHKIKRKEGDSPYEGLSPANAATVALRDEEDFSNEVEETRSSERDDDNRDTAKDQEPSFIIIYQPRRSGVDGSAVLLGDDGEAQDLRVDLRNLEASIQDATGTTDRPALLRQPVDAMTETTDTSEPTLEVV